MAIYKNLIFQLSNLIQGRPKKIELQ